MTTVSDAQDRTQAALSALVSARRLPEDVQARAVRLLSQLEAPTRVTLIGPRGTGKTGVLNLLAGREALPEGAHLGTVEVAYGASERLALTLPDGTVRHLEGPFAPEALPDLLSEARPAFSRLELPLKALGRITLLEVPLPGVRVAQMRAVAWAAKQTDIAIWCTQGFAASERTLWADIPDALKDHAILLRPRADQVGDDRAAVLDEIAFAAGDEFAHVMAVSAWEARAAQAGALGADREGLRASGAALLVSTLRRQIENGRQHVIDKAEILIQRHAEAATGAARPRSVAPQAISPFRRTPDPTPAAGPAETAPAAGAPRDSAVPAARAARPATPQPDPHLVAAPAPRPASRRLVIGPKPPGHADPAPAGRQAARAGAPAAARVPEAQPQIARPVSGATTGSRPASGQARTEAPEEAPVQPPAQPPVQPPVQAREVEPHGAAPASPTPRAEPATARPGRSARPAQPATPELLAAFGVLEGTLAGLGIYLEQLDTDNPGALLDAAADAVAQLEARFDLGDFPSAPALDGLRAMTQDVDDLIQLTRIEGGESGAVEAITALLQLKRGVQAARAACAGLAGLAPTGRIAAA